MKQVGLCGIYYYCLHDQYMQSQLMFAILVKKPCVHGHWLFADKS